MDLAPKRVNRLRDGVEEEIDLDALAVGDRFVVRPGWRVADLADPATPPPRRDALLEELLVWEAEEAAHGYRHLTVVHGDPNELDTVRHLSAFYEMLRRLAGACKWVRVRGDVGYVTVTVRGTDAEERLAEFTAAATAANPGDWLVVASAFPPVSSPWVTPPGAGR